MCFVERGLYFRYMLVKSCIFLRSPSRGEGRERRLLFSGKTKNTVVGLPMGMFISKSCILHVTFIMFRHVHTLHLI